MVRFVKFLILNYYLICMAQTLLFLSPLFRVIVRQYATFTKGASAYEGGAGVSVSVVVGVNTNMKATPAE